MDPALRNTYKGDGPSLVDIRIDPEAGAALKKHPLLSFLMFSDLSPPALLRFLRKCAKSAFTAMLTLMIHSDRSVGFTTRLALYWSDPTAQS